MKSFVNLFLLFGAAVGLVSCGGGEPSENLSESEKVRLAPAEVIEIVKSDSYLIEERFVGVVEARRRSDLAFELSGTVESVAFDEGEEVKKGEVLAQIDISRLNARKAELAASLEQARADLTLAKLTLDRNLKLVKSGAVSKLQSDQSTKDFDAAKANTNRIEAQLKSVEVDLAKSILRAPYDGTVASRKVDEGAVVSPNQVVVGFLESGALEVRAALAEEAVGTLSSGDAVAVEFGNESSGNLKVARILPQRDRATRSVDVIFELPETAASSARDGDLVTILRADSIAADGFILPRDSLTESTRGLWACFVAVADPDAGPEAYRLDRRDVEVLQEYADSVFARGSIAEGDWVLATGLQKVAPGQRVKVVNVQKPEQSKSDAANETGPLN